MKALASTSQYVRSKKVTLSSTKTIKHIFEFHQRNQITEIKGRIEYNEK